MMPEQAQGKKDGPRMDQWLTAVRIFKTRSLAADACQKGKIVVKGIKVKPSYPVKVGEVVAVRTGPITRTYKVKGLLLKRVSARAALEFLEEITPAEELEKLTALRSNPIAVREKGMGRPTKKERRNINRLKESHLEYSKGVSRI